MVLRRYGHLHGWRKDTPQSERRLSRFDTDPEEKDQTEEIECFRRIESDSESYPRGGQTNPIDRARKLIDGLGGDVRQFTEAVGKRTGVFDSLRHQSAYHTEIYAEPFKPEFVDEYFWGSTLVHDVFSRRKLKSVYRKMDKLGILLDTFDGFGADVENGYKSLVRDMKRYGMAKAMARYGLHLTEC